MNTDDLVFQGARRIANWLNSDPHHPENNVPLPNSTTLNHVDSLERDLRALEHEVRRQALLNQALWELLRDKLQVTEAMLEQKMTEIDLRDGVQDGQVTPVPLQCPKCGRISNSRHHKCLYCGLEFEKPTVG